MKLASISQGCSRYLRHGELCGSTIGVKRRWTNRGDEVEVVERDPARLSGPRVRVVQANDRVLHVFLEFLPQRWRIELQSTIPTTKQSNHNPPPIARRLALGRARAVYMRRIAQLGRWSGAYLPPRNPRTATLFCHSTSRLNASNTTVIKNSLHLDRPCRSFHTTRYARQQAATGVEAPAGGQTDELGVKPRKRRSKNLQSAKLAALHARLSLPARFSLSTLARCLTHPSADPDPDHNNASLALIGQELVAHYTSEWLICNYPRLPMPVIYAAQYAYSGNKTLTHMTREWGVEPADAPGEEVDPGYLQFERIEPGNAMAPDMRSRLKDVRPTADQTGTGRPREGFYQRRGTSSRIVYDDEFGDLRSGIAVHDTALSLEADIAKDLKATSPSTASAEGSGITLEDASASFIRAVFGALYLYSGEASLRSFHKAHILSRHLPLHTLFRFNNPIVDLARLCDREGLEPPVARLISETGRRTRSPVFVVGIYSGRDKLGEDAGASLAEGRTRAAAQALRSWYLYSPPQEHICLPSEQGDIEKKGGRWRPQHIDKGEIVT